MAKGRTISANKVTDFDKQVLEACKKLSELFLTYVPQDKLGEIKDDFAKVHSTSRDAGAGRGAGKWQRDSVTTRGTTSKTPVSNRNLRWHPLTLANSESRIARPIEGIEILEDSSGPVFVIKIKDKSGNLKKILPNDVHTLTELYVAHTEHFRPYVNKLKDWSDEDWTRNSCFIKLEEACTWQDALETFVVLGVSTLLSQFDLSGYELLIEVKDMLSEIYKEFGNFDLTAKFPKTVEDLTICPVCKFPLDNDLSAFRFSARIDTWQPIWTTSKRNEGEDSSLQVMHVKPLKEGETRHTAANVRYGHRWCNVAMTDHDLDETLAFMKEVVQRHGK